MDHATPRDPRAQGAWTRARGVVLTVVAAVGACVTLSAQAPAAAPPDKPAPPQAPAGAPPAQGSQAPAAEGQAADKKPAATVATTVKFTSPAAALLMTIKPDKVADLEGLFAQYVEALKKSGDAVNQQVAANLKVYKAAEPAPGGSNVLFMAVIDPVVPDADYSWQAFLGTIYAAFPDQAEAIFAKGTSVHAGPMNRLSLTPVALTPAAAPPADPKAAPAGSKPAAKPGAPTPRD